MKNTIPFNRLKCVLAVASLTMLMACGSGGNRGRTWAVYKGDEKSTSHSPLDQIDTSNVSALKLAWTFSVNDLPSDANPANSQSNPIIIDGIMYTTSAKRCLYAIDAATGKEIWKYDPFNGGGGGGAGRGVTYWEDGNDRRILFSADNFLIAVDAKTGKAIDTFGENGKVNLNVGLRDDPNKITVTMTSPGIIYKDLIIVGSRLPDLYGTPPGHVRAYNCRTWSGCFIPFRNPGSPVMKPGRRKLTNMPAVSTAGQACLWIANAVSCIWRWDHQPMTFMEPIV